MISKNSNLRPAPATASRLNLPDVFLLNPRHQRLLQGLSLFPNPLSLSLLLTISLLILLAVSGAALIKGAVGLNNISQLDHSRMMVQGEIIGHRRAATSTLNQGILYYVTYRFSPSADPDSDFTQEQFVTKDAYDRLSEGSPVSIKYVESDPSISTLTGENGTQAMGLTDFLLTVLGVLGTLAALVYLIPRLRQLLADVQLYQGGHLIAGHVTSCHRYVIAAPTGIRPRDYRPALSGSFFVELHYAFRTLNGKELRGSATHQRDDLAKTRLPGFGTSVAVLFLDESHYTVL